VIAPHGGRLVNRVLDGAARQEWNGQAAGLPVIRVSEETAFDVENIATGVFSPLEGFMTRLEVESVLKHRRLPNDLPWTIPIVLDVQRDEIAGIAPGNAVALAHGGRRLAVIQVAEIYRLEREVFALETFGTLDKRHPGVQRVEQMGEWLVAGPISLLATVG